MSCEDSGKCIEILHALIDGEASDEEKVFFQQHMEACIHCVNFYQLEKSIKYALQNKVRPVATPAGLEDLIRMKVGEIV